MIIPEVENAIKTLCDGQLKCVILFGVEVFTVYFVELAYTLLLQINSIFKGTCLC